MASLGLPDPSASAQLVGALAASGPEITVRDGETDIIKGQTVPINIGSAFGGKAGPSKTFTIQNDGNATLALSKRFLSTSHFTVSQPLKTSLLAGQTTTFTVTLKTAAIWTGFERVSFTNNDADNGDGVESPFTFTVSGSVTPVPPEITVLLGTTRITSDQPIPIDFGTAVLGMTGSSKTFTIRNDGKLTLVLTAPVANTAHFTVSQPTRTSLAPGKTATFKVTLNTGAIWTGSEPEQILLLSNDADNGDGIENPFELAVSGKVSPLVVNIADSAARNEGNSGTTKFPFVVTLSPPCPRAVSVKYETANGVAIAGVDYTAAHGTLTFSPGQTQKTINVSVKGDTLYEANNQTFAVNLVSTTLGTINRGSGTGTILNDDSAPMISVTDVADEEGNSDSTAFIFEVRLSKASALPVTAQVYTEDGTTPNSAATVADNDYVPRRNSSPYEFAPGDTQKIVVILVKGDAKFEPNETFFVKLTGVTGATVLRTGTGTILNDDAAPKLAPVVDIAAAVKSPVVAVAASSASLSAQSDATAALGSKSQAAGSVSDQAITSLLDALAVTQKPKSRIIAQPQASAVDEMLHLMVLGARL